MLRSYGAVNVLFVDYSELHIEKIFLLDYQSEILSPVNLKCAVDNLLVEKLLNVKQYKFLIFLSYTAPYNIYIDENHAEGIDVELIEMIIAHINGSVRYSKSWHDAKTWMIGSSQNPPLKLFDFSIYRMQRLSGGNFDRVFLPNLDEICISVPMQHNRLLLLQILKPFNAAVWCLCMVLFGLRLFKKHFILFKRIYWINIILKETMKFNRFCVISFTVLQFILMEAYIAKVITFLSTMQFETNPKTLADLDREHQIFALDENDIHLLKDYPNLRFVSDIQVSIQDHAIYAVPKYCKTAEYFYNSKLNYNPETNDKIAFILEERPMSIAMFFSFTKFRPFAKLFEKYIYYLTDTGVWAKLFNQWKNSAEQFEAYLRVDKYVIKFDDLVSFWIMFAFGIVISLSIFIVELFAKTKIGSCLRKLRIIKNHK